ncbi:hypothetical protein SLEP1_g20457 [Rubroshorea leprosula]|uniref:Uncharacterized protein n=1 Tax=Rubroshorea leprosula TaxID=152421 RepID=A0AAV5J888_9ROSI|nr:hypothetical protein SLEP1_g20457 [Rubroshorea leprosula]
MTFSLFTSLGALVSTSLALPGVKHEGLFGSLPGEGLRRRCHSGSPGRWLHGFAEHMGTAISFLGMLSVGAILQQISGHL